MNELSEFDWNHKLTIVDYFDTLINQIDIASETLISENHTDENKKKEVNTLRLEFLNEIKRIQAVNLKNYEEIYYNRLNLISLSKNDQDACGRLEKITDNAIFKVFCFYVENSYLKNVCAPKNGLLVTLDWFLNENEIAFIK